MPCFEPVKAFFPRDGGRISFVERADGEWRSLPCGRCVGCLRDKSRDWSVRLVHESRTAGDSICVTLTYDEEHLPPGGSLRRADFTRFMHRLRKQLFRKHGLRVRFFAIGEYGGAGARPHYHVVLFGWMPGDAREWSKSRGGNTEFVSAELSEAWGCGFVTFQPFSPAAANYVAGYVTDKPAAVSRGRRGERLSRIVDPDSGEVVGLRESEFMVMSRRPGIGAEWLSRYGDSVRDSDFVMGAAGSRGRVPAFYDRVLARSDALEVDERKAARVARAFEPVAVAERSDDRLAVRAEVARAERDRRLRHE